MSGADVVPLRPLAKCEVEMETYRELEPAPDVEIDDSVLALRDPETGALYAVRRRLLDGCP